MALVLEYNDFSQRMGQHLCSPRILRRELGLVAPAYSRSIVAFEEGTSTRMRRWPPSK
jgi:hypothetical protein